jgi:hypothetical protein
MVVSLHPSAVFHCSNTAASSVFVKEDEDNDDEDDDDNDDDDDDDDNDDARLTIELLCVVRLCSSFFKK